MAKKVILITGATRGIGRAIAETCMDHITILIGRNETLLQSLASQIQKQGGDCKPVICDVTKEGDVTHCIDMVLQQYKRIDVLVNNAGIGQFKRVDKFTLDEFQEIYNTNMTGTFLFTKYVAPHLINQKKGQIINIASVAGLHGFKTGTAYASSKFAVIGFTESLREDLKEFGIAVSAVCPGSVATEFGGKEVSRKKESEFELLPTDVAKTVRYLIDESETANTKLIELKPRKREKYR